MREIVCILLAAGRSERFGGHKLLAPMSDHQSIVSQVLARVMALDRRVIGVIRPGDAGLATELARVGAEVIECRESAAGIGHSVRCGIRAAPAADGWLIALGDMPYIRESSYRRVLAAIDTGAAISAPVFQGRRGHPVGFDRRYRTRLESLEGDRGASRLIVEAGDDFAGIEVDDPGVLRDIDRPGDLVPKATS